MSPAPPGTVRAMTKTVFHGGQVFDGTGAPLAGADVVMEDGRIVAVGPGLDGDDGVDCAGMLVLPGLIDCHVHLAVDGHRARSASSRRRSASRFYEAIDNMAATLAAGVTTVRDAAGADLGMKTAVEKGLVPRAPDADLHHDAEPDRRPRRRLGGLRRPRPVVLRPLPGRAAPDRGRAGRDAPAGAGARPGRRRRDQGRDQRRGPVLSGRPAPRSLPGRRAGRPRRGGRGGGTVRDGPRAGDRRDQGRDPQRHPLDRARHLPRRRGHRHDARPRHLPRADARRATRRARGARAGHPRPAR